MIAKEYGITREDTDRFGLRSQQRAIAAWKEGRFDARGRPRRRAGARRGGQADRRAQDASSRDEGLRETSLEKLAALKAVVEPDGIHTAGTSSQVSDGAAAVLLASPREGEGARDQAARAHRRDDARRRRSGDHAEGPDPEQPQGARRRPASRCATWTSFEVNEAFASVVLAWEKELEPNPERVNPNGGAIALGHPTGCTGARLITTALHELERTGGRYGLIAMCCGGGLGTGHDHRAAVGAPSASSRNCRIAVTSSRGLREAS